MTRARTSAAWGLLLLASCNGPKATPSAPKAEGVVVSTASSGPRSLRELPTTDPGIAVGNLQAQIAGHERLLVTNPRATASMKALVSLYIMRAQFFGQLADYDRALALAERMVQTAPTDPEAYDSRGDCRASLHLFARALEDFDAAQRRGARADVLAGSRAAVYQALGRYGDAVEIRKRKADQWPTISSLGALASLQAERGENVEAERLFASAQDHFRDVSPFPLAWLYLQAGTMWQKAGALTRARDFFEAAHERLPNYAPAAGHLAEVLAMTGERERAKLLLTPLVEGSDDPEYCGQLALLEQEGGNAELAAALHERAARRYDELMRQHPEAFAAHAARFWLRAGDPKKALALAERNLAVRVTRDACVMVIEAALAAKQPDRACAAADRGSALERRSGDALEVARVRAFNACGRPTLRAEAGRQASAHSP